MNLESRNTALLTLCVSSIICAKAFFYLINDTEGPNLLIVVGLASALYFLSYVIYVFILSKLQGLAKLLAAVGVQILAVIVLYYSMR